MISLPLLSRQTPPPPLLSPPSPTSEGPLLSPQSPPVRASPLSSISPLSSFLNLPEELQSVN